MKYTVSCNTFTTKRVSTACYVLIETPTKHTSRQPFIAPMHRLRTKIGTLSKARLEELPRKGPELIGVLYRLAFLIV